MSGIFTNRSPTGACLNIFQTLCNTFLSLDSELQNRLAQIKTVSKLEKSNFSCESAVKMI